MSAPYVEHCVSGSSWVRCEYQRILDCPVHPDHHRIVEMAVPSAPTTGSADGRATERETLRLRALEDAVTAFAVAVGSHDPPLIGFYPPGSRAVLGEADAPRDSLREVYRLAVEAAGMLERAHGVGTNAVAVRLRQWCDANRERCK